MDKFNRLKTAIENSEADFNAFYSNGTKAAGTRVRKVMLEVKNLAHEIRKEISEKKNT